MDREMFKDKVSGLIEKYNSVISRGEVNKYNEEMTKTVFIQPLFEALGWKSRHTPQQAIVKSVRWYVDNEWWWRSIKSGEFKEYYRRMYEEREGYTAP